MPRRLGQHFLRPASVEELAPRDRARGRATCSSRSAPAAAPSPSRSPSAARASWRWSSTRRSRAALRARRPANVEIVDAGRARARTCARLVPAGARLAGNLPYYISSPLLRRFLDLHDHVRDLHVMLQEEVARRVASPPGSKEYGILSVLYAPLGRHRPPRPLPARLLLAPAQGRLGRAARAVSSTTPRADVGDLEAFERFVQTAFARRRRTLENNLQDSYPNLKEYLRFLNVEGSRRAETLSVVEFAATLARP